MVALLIVLVELLTVKLHQYRLFYSTVLKLGRYVNDDMLLHIR